MLGSSGKTPSNPVIDSDLKESVDRFTKIGRQSRAVSAAEGSVVRAARDTTGTERECVDCQIR